MWKLLGAAWQLLPADTAPPIVASNAAIAGARDLLADGQHLADEFKQVLAYMAEQGYQDTPEFQEIRAAFKEVTYGVGELKQELEGQAAAG